LNKVFLSNISVYIQEQSDREQSPSYLVSMNNEIMVLKQSEQNIRS